MKPHTVPSDPAKADKRLWNLQWVIVFASVLAFAAAQWNSPPGEAWHSPWLLAALGAVLAALLLLAWRIRAEARLTRRPPKETALFTSTMFNAGLLAAIAGSMIAGALLATTGTAIADAFFGKRLEWLTALNLAEDAMLGLLAGWLVMARVRIVNRLVRDGRKPPDDGTGFDKFEDWSCRHLGRWWAAEAAFLAIACICLIGVSWSFGGAWTGLLILTFQPGQRLYVAMAYDRGLPWPEKEVRQQALARWNEVQRSPAFKALRARNEWLENWAAATMLLGLVCGSTAAYHFVIYADARLMWFSGLIFGGLAGWPTVAIFLATRLQSRARWDDYVTYFRMRNGETGTRTYARVAFGSLMLMAMSAVGLMLNLLFTTSG